MNQDPLSASPFLVGDWLVEPALLRAARGDRQVSLEPRVLHVLLCLTAHAGDVVSRTQLLDEVWPDRVVGEDSLTNAVSDLRRLFGDTPHQPWLIQTVRSRGYRLIAPVLNLPKQDPTAPTVIQPILSERATSPHRMPSSWLFGAAAVLLVVVTGTLLLTSSNSPQLPPQARITPLTSRPGVEQDPALSPDGAFLAFVTAPSSPDGADLYVKVVGTESTMPLTRHPGAERSPVFSPDGRHLAFLRFEDGTCGLYLIPALGGTETRLTDCSPAAEPGLAWSPDGALLAFSDRRPGDTAHRIYTFTLDSRQVAPRTTPPQGYAGDTTPAFSPDGRRLAFTRSRAPGASDLYVLSVPGGPARRLTQDNLKYHGLVWTPDGTALVTASNRTGGFSLWRIDGSDGTPAWLGPSGAFIDFPTIDAGGRIAFTEWSIETNIYRLPLDAPDTTGPPADPEALVHSSRSDWNPDLSSDGRRMAFVSDRTGTTEIWMSDSLGRDAVRLTEFGGPYVSNPRWSPDGRRIAFDARLDGRADIYLLDPDTRALQRLAGPGTENVAPHWSRDGRQVYFASNEGGTWQVWKTAPSGGSPAQVTRHGGFVARESPDGRALYVSKRDQPGLWKVPIGGEAETLLIEALAPVDGVNWEITPQGIYYLGRTQASHPELRFYDFGSGISRQVAPLPKFLYKSGMSVSSDGQWLLFARLDRSESDILYAQNLPLFASDS